VCVCVCVCEEKMKNGTGEREFFYSICTDVCCMFAFHFFRRSSPSCRCECDVM